jgi:hypothetical protein
MRSGVDPAAEASWDGLFQVSMGTATIRPPSNGTRPSSQVLHPALCGVTRHWCPDGWQRTTLRLTADQAETLGKDQYAAGLKHGECQQRPDRASHHGEAQSRHDPHPVRFPQCHCNQYDDDHSAETHRYIHI